MIGRFKLRVVALICILVVIPLATCAAATSPAQTSPAQPFDPSVLDRYFDALESNNRLMGSVAVAKNGEIVYKRAFGFRTRPGDGGPKSDPQTLFRIGSVTKIHTATMIYQLIEARRLALDTPLAQFFPRITNADRITIAHLLAHCTGIADYTRQIDASDPKDWSYAPQTKDAMLARFAASKPEFEPGERVSYSNTNYVLLGYIIEAVTKSTYGAQLDKRIVKRAGLSRTRYGGAVDAGKNEAHSYTYGDGIWTQAPESDPSVPAAAGAIVSTPSDLVRFVSKLFDAKLIGPQSIEEMTQPFSENLAGAERKGVVVFTLGRWLNQKAYSHRGGIDAFQSNLVYLPEERLGIALTFNGQNYPMGKVFWSVLEAYYGRPVATPSFTSIGLAPAALERFHGAYTCKDIGMEISIQSQENGLLARVTGQDEFALEPIGEALFSHAPSGILVEFKPAEDGSILSFALFQGAGELRFARNAVPK